MYHILIPTKQLERVKQDLVKYPIEYDEKPLEDADGRVYFTQLSFNVEWDRFKEIAAFIRNLGVDAYGIDTQITGPSSLMEIIDKIARNLRK